MKMYLGENNKINKKISVCMATHNGMPYIREQIYSIISQLGETDELIISDDGSTDGTIEYIKELSDSRIKLFYLDNQEEEKGGIFTKMKKISKNFENSLKNASGDLIFLSDQDDIWENSKIEKSISYLKGIGLIHDCSIIDNDYKVIGQSIYQYIKPKKNVIGILWRSSMMGCCMSFEKKVLRLALPFPNIPIEHDTWIGLCIIKLGRLDYIYDKLIKYRRHNNNVSSCFQGSPNSFLIKLKRRGYIIIGYFIVLYRLLKNYFIK